MTDDILNNPQTPPEPEPIVEEPVGPAENEITPEEPVVLQPRIILKRNNAETNEVFEVHPPATIGRFDPTVGPIDIDLGPLDEGRYVSRKHAKVVCEDDVWKLVDLGSSNGTFALRSDFERVEEVELTDGTEFALGNARFVFRLTV